MFTVAAVCSVMTVAVAVRSVHMFEVAQASRPPTCVQRVCGGSPSQPPTHLCAARLRRQPKPAAHPPVCSVSVVAVHATCTTAFPGTMRREGRW